MRTTKAQISLHIRAVGSAFVRCLDSIIHILAISKISRLYITAEAQQAGLSLTWSHTSKDGPSRDVAHLCFRYNVGKSLVYQRFTDFNNVTNDDDNDMIILSINTFVIL